MHLVLSFFLMIYSFLAMAQETFPHTCQGLPLQKESIILSAKHSMLVLLYNKSSDDIWITHPVSNVSASAGWSSRLEAGKWSALALDKKHFELSCVESKPGHEQQVSCVELVTVCEWTNVIFPEKNTGTFWAAENMNLSSLTIQLGEKGYKLPNVPQ